MFVNFCKKFYSHLQKNLMLTNDLIIVRLIILFDILTPKNGEREMIFNYRAKNV